jgi:hypothetical protein
MDPDGKDDIHFFTFTVSAIVPAGNGGFKRVGQSFHWVNVVKNDKTNTYTQHTAGYEYDAKGKRGRTFHQDSGFTWSSLAEKLYENREAINRSYPTEFRDANKPPTHGDTNRAQVFSLMGAYENRQVANEQRAKGVMLMLDMLTLGESAVLLDKLGSKGLSALFGKGAKSAWEGSGTLGRNFLSHGEEFIDEGIRSLEMPVEREMADLVSFRKEHILNRHRPGAGVSGKTEFPTGWSDEKIIDVVNQIANDPKAVGGMGKWNSPYKIGKVEGVEIRVDFYPTTHSKYSGQVSTAYPTNVNPNP